MKNKKNNKKGFTLAELLIVVAIIAVLVAIAIPVFSAQLEKAREATDAANIRAEYAEIMTEALTGDTIGTHTVTLKQQQDNWQNENNKTGLQGAGMTLSGEPKKSGTATLTYDATTQKCTVTFS